MKKLLIVVSLLSGLLGASEALAAKWDLAEEIVDKTAAGQRFRAPQRPANKPAPKLDPARTAEHFRQLAVEFFVKEMSEEELRGVLDFYRSPTGSRFLKLDDRIEREVLTALYSGEGEGEAAAAAAAKGPDVTERTELAEELMKTPAFEARVKEHATVFDQSAAGGKHKKVTSATLKRVRKIYVERYSARLIKRFLIELVDFHTSELGKKYAGVQAKLAKALQKEAQSYTG